MRGFLIAVALICPALSALSAPPQTATEQQEANKSALASVLSRLDKAEARLDALEGKNKVGAGDPLPPLPPLKQCECQTGERCVCGTVCTCASTGKKAAPKGTVYLIKGYVGGVECWIPEGYTMEGWSKTAPTSAPVQWDCSSGTCRPVSSSPQGMYGAPIYGSGGFSSGMFSGGGSCAGGSCGGSSGMSFGRRR